MKLSHWAKQQGITYKTAWNMYKAGLLNDIAYRLPTGTIHIKENTQENIKQSKVVTYARVSSFENKDNLDKQSQRLQDYCFAKGHKIDKNVKEIGSGLNDKRKQCKRKTENSLKSYLMIRSSKHILKYQTTTKSGGLDLLFDLYKKELEYQIYLIWNDIIPLKRNLSSKELEGKYIQHSRWLQNIYKQASEIVRLQRKKKNKIYPIIKNIGINVDQRFFNIQEDNSKEFDGFIKLILPIFYKNKKKAISINIPFKHHKHSLKYKGWTRKNTIKLTCTKGSYYLHFIYEKEVQLKTQGSAIGLDSGMNKLFITSEGKIFGIHLNNIYHKLTTKVKGSKKSKKLLDYRTNEINRSCNSFDLSNVKTLVIEDLKNLKRGKNKKRSKKFRCKQSHWLYRQVITKLERLCEENGVCLIKVNPAYTSQTCSICGSHGVRQNEIFTCEKCSIKIDADYNASINILHRGIYSSSTPENLIKNNFL